MKKFYGNRVTSLAIAAVLSAFDSGDALSADKFPTGLIPDSPEQIRAMEKKHRVKKVKKVRPNALGLSRINAERARKGERRIDPKYAAPIGDETLGEISGESSPGTDIGFEGLVYGASLTPSGVDNSLLKSFPPISHQGAVGSCASFATGYYQYTHLTGMLMGYDNKASAARRCSPSFVFNLVAGDVNCNGSSILSNMDGLIARGCAPVSSFPIDARYCSTIPTQADTWMKAIDVRAETYEQVTDLDGFVAAKGLLNNGYVLSAQFGIDDSFRYAKSIIKANPASTSNPYVGQLGVVRPANPVNVGLHAMAVVGYDDNAWVDGNGNDVIDPGEVGVFKIANSWGPEWGNQGFMFVTYDWYDSTGSKFLHIKSRVRPGALYKPKIVAEVAADFVHNDSILSVGVARSTGLTPWAAITPMTRAYDPTQRTSATVVFDLTERLAALADPVSNIFAEVRDRYSGNVSVLRSAVVRDLSSQQIFVTGASLPLEADASTVSASIAVPKSTEPAPSPSPSPVVTTTASPSPSPVVTTTPSPSPTHTVAPPPPSPSPSPSPSPTPTATAKPCRGKRCN